MSRKRRLAEGPTRLAQTRQVAWDEAVPRYLGEVVRLQKEAARSHRFAMLLQQLLGLEPGFIETYAAGIEQFLKVKQKDRILKGQADNLFGNVILEFEANLPKKRAEAEEQLRRYLAILWSQEPPESRTPYLGLVTDGIRFATYSPVLAGPPAAELVPQEVTLHLLEESDWTRLAPHEVYYWLDRHFLRQEILPPTSERVVADFGVRSHAFRTATNALQKAWKAVKRQGAFAVIYEGWEKYLRVVYGGQVAGDELFVRHTYLATLAKLMAWIRLAESPSLPEEGRIAELLEGRLFAAEVKNFVEEDFFSWPARGEAARAASNVTRWLFSLLQNYNLRELAEDVLKSLYQELVDPETRHDLGEFYTPDWLAGRMLRQVLDDDPRRAVLDPACGSGTFLYLAIREKRRRLGDSVATLYHLLETVCGADIHPLAVTVAKTNYVLALGDLLRKREKAVYLPVCLADTLRLPEYVTRAKMVAINGVLVQQLSGYCVVLDGYEIHLPEALLADPAQYDQAIDLAKEFALQNRGQPIRPESFRDFLASHGSPALADPSLADALFSIAEALQQFIEASRDSIWAFVLKNIYKPLFFKGKFDLVVGNPPWIAFRYLEPDYQKFLKAQIVKRYQLLSGRGELITHLEIATLFLARAADLYLKPGGTIAFVLPKSIFSADQHDILRRREFKFSEDEAYNLSWRELWDCEKVTPLFHVPACVVLADKQKGAKAAEPLPGQVLSGSLARKNASLKEAEAVLTAENVQFSRHTRGRRSFWSAESATHLAGKSYYRDRFFQGASLVPRSFWFVRVKALLRGVGVDTYQPPVETDPRATKEAKAPYKEVRFRSPMRAEFLYATLLSTDLIPFGHLGYRMVVLPLWPETDHYRLLSIEEAHRRGYYDLRQWLERAEAKWTARRGTKAGRLSVSERLDYRRKLTSQNPQAKYRVLYNASGTYLAAAVVPRRRIRFEVDGQKVEARGFVADTKTYFCETDEEQEALYLTAVLNAPVIDRLIKPMQSRGLWGPRDIHKKVLEFPIPRFDPKNAAHRRLAKLGIAASAKVKRWLAGGEAAKGKNIGRLRARVRELLGKELQQIDQLVARMLQ